MIMNNRTKIDKIMSVKIVSNKTLLQGGGGAGEFRKIEAMEDTAAEESPSGGKEEVTANFSFDDDNNNDHRKKNKMRKKKKKNHHGGSGDFVDNLSTKSSNPCFAGRYVEIRKGDDDSVVSLCEENEKGSMCLDGDQGDRIGEKRKMDVKIFSQVGFCGEKIVEEVGMGSGEEKDGPVASDVGGVTFMSKEALDNLFAQFRYTGGKHDRNASKSGFVVGNRQKSSVLGAKEAVVLSGVADKLKGDAEIEKDMGGISSRLRKRGEKVRSKEIEEDRKKRGEEIRVVSPYFEKHTGKVLVEEGEKHLNDESQKSQSQNGILGTFGANEAVHSCGACEESVGTNEIEKEYASVLSRKRISGEKDRKDAGKEFRVVSPYFVKSAEEELLERCEKHLSSLSRKQLPKSKISEISGAGVAVPVHVEFEENMEIEKEVFGVFSRRRRSGEKDRKNARKEARVVSPYFVKSAEEELLERCDKHLSTISRKSLPKSKISEFSGFGEAVSEHGEFEENKEIEEEVSGVFLRMRRSGEKDQKNARKEVRVVSPYFVKSVEEEMVEHGEQPFSNRSRKSQPKTKISGISCASDTVPFHSVREEFEENKKIEKDVFGVSSRKRRSGEKGRKKDARKEVRVVKSVEEGMVEKDEQHFSNRSRKSQPKTKMAEIFGASEAASLHGVCEELEENKTIEKEVSGVSFRKRSGEEDQNETRKVQVDLQEVARVSSRKRRSENGRKEAKTEVQVASPYSLNSKCEEEVFKGGKLLQNMSQKLNQKTITSGTLGAPEAVLLHCTSEELKETMDFKEEINGDTLGKTEIDGKNRRKSSKEVRIVSPYFAKPVNKEEVKKKENHLKTSSQKSQQKTRITVRKISPYFQKNNKQGDIEVATEIIVLPKRSQIAELIQPSLSAAQKRDEAYKRRTSDNLWKPPKSPYNLLQEDHAHDPWRVLVICILLNRTTGLQASRVINELFTLCPNAQNAANVDPLCIEKLIQSLGLHKKRAVMIQRFSVEYLGESWTHVTQLHGIGKYAADAYAIFCTGEWDRVRPLDHMLCKYWDFLRQGCKTFQPVHLQKFQHK